jgi:DNA polymerase III epsilon subunit-like protein
MKYLIFDTETTGLPPNDIKSVSQLTFSRWPRIVSLSFIVYDTITREKQIYDKIACLPEDAEMSEETVSIHGISKEISRKHGVPTIDILNEFLEQYYSVDCVSGHNVNFDVNMVMSELYRLKATTTCDETQINTHIQQLALDARTRNSKICCTMKIGKDLCAIKSLDKNGKAYIKSPKLIELYQQLFDDEKEFKLVARKLHNSFIDVLVTFRCFYKIHHKIDICSYDETIGELWLSTFV